MAYSGSQQQQAEAWEAVFNKMHARHSGFLRGDKNGMASALDELDRLYELQAENERLCKVEESYKLLATSINTHPGECLPECDSYGHAEGCTFADDVANFLVICRENERLQAELKRSKLREPPHCSTCSCGTTVLEPRECPNSSDGKHQTHHGGPDCRYCDGIAVPTKESDHG